MVLSSVTLDVDGDIDGVNERSPKPLCPYHLITSQYANLLELLIQEY